MRAFGGEVRSSTSARLSPAIPLAAVQFWPPSDDVYTPLDAARYRTLLSAGSTMITLIVCPMNWLASPVFEAG